MDCDENCIPIPIKFEGLLIGHYNLLNLFSDYGNYLHLGYNYDEQGDSGLVVLRNKFYELFECLGYDVQDSFGEYDIFITGFTKKKDIGELTDDDILKVIKGEKCFSTSRGGFSSEQEDDEDLESDFEDDTEDEDEEENKDFEADFEENDESEEDDDYEEGSIESENILEDLPPEIKRLVALLSEHGLEIDEETFVLFVQRTLGVLIYRNAKDKLGALAEYFSKNKIDIVENTKFENGLLEKLLNILANHKTN